MIATQATSEGGGDRRGKGEEIGTTQCGRNETHLKQILKPMFFAHGISQ